MALSPLVLVQDGAGLWVATTNGVDVTPGNTISIKLVDTSDAVDWYLQILGTDELITYPALVGVNPLDNKVTTTTTVVTFTMPAGFGHALRFQSQVTGTGGPLTTTFGIYALTAHGRRVGASTEEREGNSTYGWITITNPILRSGAAVVYYNDAAVGPPFGVSTVQGALDYLKAGGGFTPGGDLTGSSTAQTVSYIRGVISPDPILALHGKLTAVVEDYPAELFSPRAVVTDGIDLYVAQSTMLFAVTLNGSGFVHKLRPVEDGSILEVVGKVDLTTVLPTISRVRDLAVDSTYIYAACWGSANIAIIDKATMAIAGWGYLAGGQATSVCADGAGYFYCYDNDGPLIGKFSTAACLGQPPSTVGPSLTYTPSSGRGRWVRFGGGYLWFTDAGNGIGTQKIDPATMTLVINDASATGAMSSLYAFGSVWVTDGTSLKRLDPTTLALQFSIPLTNSNTPSEIVLGPNSTGTPNTRIYVSDENTKYIFIVNPLTNTLEATFAPGANKFSGVATIGNVVYAMAYVYGMWEAPNGIFFINYPTGIVGAVTYKPKLEYQSQGKFDRGYVGNVLLGRGMYAGRVGEVPRVVDAITEPLDMAYDSRLDPAVDEGPYIWIPRKKSQDIICWDLYTDAFGYTIPLQLAGENFDPHTVLVSPKYVWVLGCYGHIVKIDRVTRDVLDYRLKFPTKDYNGNEGLAWDDLHGCVLTTGGNTENGIIYSLDATTHRITRHDLSATINEPGTGIIAVGTKAFYFGVLTFWQIDLTTWVVGPPISIPNSSWNRVRAKYEGGYIWFISQGGTDLARVDPVTAAISSITVGYGTMGMAYSADDDAVLVTINGTGIQYVENATGVMSLGVARGLFSPSTMGGIIYDPTYSHFYFTCEEQASPYNAGIVSIIYGSVSTIDPSEPDNWINGRMEWFTPASFTAGGDLSGSASSQTVIGLRGRTIATTAPSNGQVLTWSAGSSWWYPAAAGGLPTATLAGDLVSWSGSAWEAKQPPAGLINVKANPYYSLTSGMLVKLIRDPAGTTSDFLAYPYARSYSPDWQTGLLHYSLGRATWTTRFLGDKEAFNAAALDDFTFLVAYFDGSNAWIRAMRATSNDAEQWSVVAATVEAMWEADQSAGSITNICITRTDATHFVLGYCLNGRPYVVGGVYVNFTTPVTLGTDVAVSADTDVFGLAVSSTLNTVTTTNGNFIVAYGKSTTNTGYLVAGNLNLSTLAITLGSPSSSTFGNATCPPRCITIQVLYNANTYGILYGNKGRGVDIFNSNRVRVITQQDVLTNAVFRADAADTMPAGLGYLLDGVTEQPGYGCFVGDQENHKFINIFQGTTTGYTDRTIISAGDVQLTLPVCRRPQILPHTTANWDVRNFFVRPLGQRTFAWTGRMVTPTTYLTNHALVVGVGKFMDDGGVALTSGALFSGADLWYWAPSIPAYVRSVIVPMGNGNRFVVVTTGQTRFGADQSVAYCYGVSEKEQSYGIMQEAAAVGETKRCITPGGISRVHTGLIPGATYYFGFSGAVSRNQGGPPIGIAISTTELALIGSPRVLNWGT